MFQKYLSMQGPHKKGFYAATAIVQSASDGVCPLCWLIR